MSSKRRSLVLVAFGLAVIMSGCLRYFGQEGGIKGLVFGLVMGPLALVAAGVITSGWRRLGRLLGLFSILTVGGWFGYESLVIKGIGSAEPRQLIVIGCSIFALVAMLLPSSD